MSPCNKCRGLMDPPYPPIVDINIIASIAAENGHLECLHCAREKGARMLDSIAYFAAEGGHMRCVRYAHEQGAPLDGVDFLPHDDFVVTRTSWDCFRYISLYLPSWPSAPPEMAAWRARVRATAAAVLRIVRRNRAHAAATVIQRFWLERHYAPGGRGHAFTLARLLNNRYTLQHLP